MESTVTSTDFINTLKTLKIRSESCTVNKVQHLFDDKDTIELLTFFCKNITNENLVLNDELNSFMHLEEKYLALEGNELERAISEIEDMYPNLLELDEEDLKFIEEELEDEKKYLKDLETLIVTEIDNNGRSDENIHLLEEENIKLSASSDIQAEKLMILSTNLNSTQENLKKSIFDLINFYHKSSTSYADHFIHNTKSNVELLQNFLYNYMKTGFNNNTQSQVYSSNLLIANLNALKLSLKEKLELNIISLCELQYQKDVYETTKDWDKSKLPNNSQIDYEILRMQKNVELLQQDISSINCHLNASIEQLADSKITDVMVKFTTGKLDSYLKNQEKITNLSTHVINVRNQCRILDGFLHLIFDDLIHNQQIILDTMRQLSNDQSNLNKRLALMNYVTKEYKTVQSQSVLKTNKFLQILSKIVLNNDDSEPENLICLSQNCEQIEMNFNQKQKNVYRLECELFINTLRPLKMKVKPMLKLIFSDEHTSRPVVDNINVLKIIHQIEKHINGETESLTSITNKLKKLVKQLSNDKWFNYHHFLWVWFLINPKKVHKVLREIKDEVQNLSNEEN